MCIHALMCAHTHTIVQNNMKLETMCSTLHVKWLLHHSVHIHTHTNTHTHTHTHAHACTRVHIQTYIIPHIHTYIHTYIHIYIHVVLLSLIVNIFISIHHGKRYMYLDDKKFSDIWNCICRGMSVVVSQTVFCTVGWQYLLNKRIAH